MAKKRANWSKQKAEFQAGLAGYDAFDHIFSQEQTRQAVKEQEKAAHLRYKACESKQRYHSADEAQRAIDDCARYGTRGLSMYKCPHCNGWHITSKQY